MSTVDQSFLMPTVVHNVLQPGHPDELFHCIVKRERTRTKCTYTLSLLVGSPSEKEGKFLLAARRVSHFRKEYVIYSDDAAENVMSKGSVVHVVGKLRSDTMSKSFTIYESQLPHHNGVVSSNHGRSTSSTEVLPGVKAGNFKVGQVDYDQELDCDLSQVPNKIRRRPWYDLPQVWPRRMRCTLHTINASTIDAKGFPRAISTEVSAPRITINDSFRSSGSLCCLQSKAAVSDSSAANFEPLVLKSRAPWWSEKVRRFCLRFRGFATGLPAINDSHLDALGLPSIKNFQLVATTEPNQMCSKTNDKVLLQLLKIGKDTFRMDYRYPFSAFQAFAICVSSCR